MIEWKVYDRQRVTEKKEKEYSLLGGQGWY
jgi:hypothetical protein